MNLNFSRFCLRLVPALMFSASATFSLSAHAGSTLPAPATEGTQVLNNIQLAASVAKQAATVTNTANTYMQTIRMWEQQILAAQRLGQGFKNLQFGQLGAELQRLQAFRSSLERAGVSVGAIQNSFEQRRVSAAQQNLTLEQYAAREEALLSERNKVAVERMNREKQLLTQTQEDFEFARQQASTIDSSIGIHQSMQQLNFQTNKMIQQNARLLEVMAKAYNSDKVSDDRNLELDQRRAAEAKMLRDSLQRSTDLMK